MLKILKIKTFAIISLASFFIPSCLDLPKETSPGEKSVKPTEFNIKPSPNITKKTFQNEIFWDVTIEKISPDKYNIKGKVKILISSFNYVVEDGHYQLIKSIVSVNKGATEWGLFNFIFSATKKDYNSTLMLALYKDNPKEKNTLFIPLD